MVNTLIPGQLGRLTAYGANAPVTAKIPMYNPIDGKIYYVTPDQIALGASAVDGPVVATDNALARFDGTTGKIIQNSAVTVADTTGAVTFSDVGGGLIFKRGTNARTGTVVLTAGAGTVTNTSVAITDSIILSLNTVGGVIASQPYVATITASTGFTVAGGGASNTSTYNYTIFSNAA